ncbi:GNAT family N-acetyltransferase [Tissierella sp. Yu-01]|uniref:GNAT family N-acetyltransferase n=1 Tax=Tissierella sp. Yu-01 TaxID=3035694 RepID=UPI00240E4B66|nr:GNAT family N-acetyltransferase [Tissierella sp. Yu-01]WFA09235.1 GNAT family N-acetyltransferase [Tissierella sp. Yu-01]
MISEDYKLTVIRADKLDFDVRQQMSEIFAEGFTQWLGYFSKDKNIIAKAFAHMFVLDQFYVAVEGNKIAGMAACTDCRTLALKLNKKELRKHLGFLKGSIAGVVLKKEFENPFKNPPLETGSIELVGTATEFRGKGVASQIIRYIIRNTIYRTYLIEEVADTNTPAMNLYKKLGFEEYRRKPVPQKRAEKIGINNFIALKYIK